MVYQAEINYRAPNARDKLMIELSAIPMTSKQCKAAYKARQKANEPSWAAVKEMEEEMKVSEEQWKKEEKLRRLRERRLEKVGAMKAAKEALRKRPGPLPAKWSSDEPKARITDFFKVLAK